MNPDYLLLEISASAFFIGAALAALRRGRLPFLELISAATFGILLEEGDQLDLPDVPLLPRLDRWTIDRAPVVIGLTWALIIAGAMRLTDALGVRRRYAPFVDACWPSASTSPSTPSPSGWACGPGAASARPMAGSASRPATSTRGCS